MPNAPTPRVTIVMISRERHALTESALECLVQNTPRPYRLVYTDGQTPEWLWQRLEQRAPEWQLELVRYDEPIWPQALRNRLLPTIDSEFIIFIDNDVAVYPGWLQNLVKCADETGAGIVGPLYLWGDGINPPLIHMAGGILTRASTADGDVMLQEHIHENAPAADVMDKIERLRCDNVEFHCMLVRTAPLKDMGGFDERVLNVHEHVDASLSMLKQGYPTYLEPAAKVNFLHFAPYQLGDIAVFRWRWASENTEASIQAFCDKWKVLNHPTVFDPLRIFTQQTLSAGIDPIRSEALSWQDTQYPIKSLELAQTRSALLDQAIARGYQEDELKQLADGYRMAQAVTDGGYRPCGRPFINHLTGTASILIRYGFKIEMVLAGMLHAVYDHAPQQGDRAVTRQVLGSLMGGLDSPVESRVRAYTFRNNLYDIVSECPTEHLDISQAETLLLTLANELEMHLSGEVRYTGRTNSPPPHVINHALNSCRILGVPGMGATLMECMQASPPPIAIMTKLTVSYRMKADRKHVTPMTNLVLDQTENPHQNPRTHRTISHIPFGSSHS